MIAGLYRALTTAGVPALRAALAWRRRRGKEAGGRLGERLGRASRDRPGSPLVWLHAASVGELVSALPLLDRIGDTRPRLALLVTTGTVTSARLAAERLPAGAIHQFVPVDAPPWVRRFLDHWRPDAALVLESELWPNLVLETGEARGIPLALVNGRLSADSYRRWRRVPGLAARLLGAFRLVLAQTADDADRFTALGARHVACPGNLKYATPPLTADPAAVETLRAAVDGRPCWLLASSHPGEEQVAARLHRQLAAHHPGLLTLVAPRHPERGPAIARTLEAEGLTVARRGAGERPDAATDLYVADTLGELGLFYRAVPLVVMGKTLAAAGGQNPLEPARLGCAVVAADRMDNFAEVAGRMAEAGALTLAPDADGVSDVLDRLLADPAERARRGDTARRFAEAEADVLPAVEAALAPVLDAAEGA